MSPKGWIAGRIFGWLGGIAVLLLALAPFYLSSFRLGLLGQFLALAILALGLDLLWGYTGLLSLGQGVFFGLGAYGMAMHLKLQSSPGGLPDFMNWSGVSELPWFWTPFQSFAAAVCLAILVPMSIAAVLGALIFRSRVRGVYFTILTQALVLITVTLFVGQQGYTGGTNGITGLSTILGFPLTAPLTKVSVYLATVLMLVLSFLMCRWLVKSRLGRVLVAIRDGEERVRFSGYDPAAFKAFVYSVSAGLAGLAGMIFVLHVGIIAPAMMDIVSSIEVALWVAIGGRGTLIGAVIGAVVTNVAKTFFSETYPALWTFLLGGLFVTVVVFLPGGIWSLPGRVAGIKKPWRIKEKHAKGPEHEKEPEHSTL